MHQKRHKLFLVQHILILQYTLLHLEMENNENINSNQILKNNQILLISVFLKVDANQKKIFFQRNLRLLMQNVFHPNYF